MTSFRRDLMRSRRRRAVLDRIVSLGDHECGGLMSSVRRCVAGLVAILLVATAALAASRLEAAPTYRGFPIYPPELLGSIRGRSRFSLPMPERRAILSGASRKVVDRALSRAHTFLNTQPKKYGWQLLTGDIYGDGGSQSWDFVKRVGDTLLVVGVSFFDAGGEVQDDKDWGTLVYAFSTQRPAMRRGFPL